MEAAHENARTGDNSLFAEVVGSEQPTFSELTDLKVKSGQTYSLGVWIKVRNGTAGTVRLAIPGEHGEMLAEQAVPTRALPSGLPR